MRSEKVIEIKNLRISYLTRRGPVSAVDNVSFSIMKEETLGLVGESGCGKTSIGNSILKILPKNSSIEGKILFEEKNLVELGEKEMQKIRGLKISMIFQDPMTSLNPIMKLRDHFVETIKTHKPEISEDKAEEMAEEAFKAVGIEPSRLKDYPFQLSGGMRQRAMIALALVLNPKFVIADEPTTSLDVIVQAQILELLKNLKEKYKMSIMLITHDLGVVAEMADRIGVMYAGNLVEEGLSEKIYYEPKHPYTEALLKSIPNTKPEDKKLIYIPGNLPDLINPPTGCRFSPRCPKAMKICFEEEPPIFEVDGSKVKCWLYKGAEIVENERVNQS
ncbi:MAG: peptide/nickel transport system ATP-binding protein [Thermotogaceae bacterium]|nr:peptide/nickel transport system ATP-binding protein [Thermotogaceae bacterium]MDN5337606.1 peptide/nickel transport system ATP-binding protein [Thermotogaceae bacterium]